LGDLMDQRLSTLSDIAAEAHASIQQDFENINPIIGVSQNMRASGFPADAMTIDCLQTNKRIILILHDHQPDTISLQFSFRDKDPDDNFEKIAFNVLTAEKMYEWMKAYFSSV
jgi:hypothetical protein